MTSLAVLRRWLCRVPLPLLVLWRRQNPRLSCTVCMQGRSPIWLGARRSMRRPLLPGTAHPSTCSRCRRVRLLLVHGPHSTDRGGADKTEPQTTTTKKQKLYKNRSKTEATLARLVGLRQTRGVRSPARAQLPRSVATTEHRHA